MATVIDSIDIRGLRKVHFEQMLSYVEDREREGWYYGNYEHFEIRHIEIKVWLQGIINLLEEEGIIVPTKSKKVTK